jgi:TonB family protein
MSNRSIVSELLILLLVMSLPNSGSAQTGGDVTLSRLTLPMSATSYPVESLARNEEGTFVFDLSIGVDGAVTNAEIVEPTGYPLLDDLALRVIRNVKLPTQPLAPDGTPTTGRLLADVIWKLPLEPAGIYMQSDLDSDAPIPEGDDVVGPSPGEFENRISESDYLEESVRRGETGVVLLRVFVNAEGTVENTRLELSSGYQALDDAALRAAMGFRFNPGTISGEPSAMWAKVPVRFALGGAGSHDCRGAPGISRDARRQRRLSDGGVPIYERYTLVNEQGIIEDSLLLTDQGWMRLGAEHLAAMNQRANYGPASPGANGPRPSTCWLYDASTR